MTASVCLYFTRALRPTGFLDGPVLEAARTACRINPKEIRDLKDQGPSSTVKMAMYQSMPTDMRGSLWADRSWGAGDKDARMVYLGCEWGFDQGVYGTRTWATGSLCPTDRFTVQGCWVRASSHKTGTIVKQKFIGRRAPLEEQFLNNLVELILRSGMNGGNRLFTRYIDLEKV